MELTQLLFRLFPATLARLLKETRDSQHEASYSAGYSDGLANGRLIGYENHKRECFEALKVSPEEFEKYLLWAKESI